jgi:hypothetical protein
MHVTFGLGAPHPESAHARGFRPLPASERGNSELQSWPIRVGLGRSEFPALPEPFAGLFSVAENILGKGLDPSQANQPVRFLDRNRAFALSLMPARTRRE